jgi:ABC-2 type transport system permease protein
MIILRFALRRGLGNPLLAAALFLLPAAVVFLPRAPGSALPVGFHIYGIMLLFTAFLMIRMIVEDRENGVLQRIGAAPVTHFRYLLESLVAFAIVLLAQNALVVGLGVVVHRGSLTAPWRLFAAYAVFSSTAIAFCLAICELFRLREAAYGACSGLIIVISMLGGAYFPVEIMPASLQRVAMVTPTYWLFNALRIAEQGDHDPRFALSLGIMVLFTVAFLIAGSKRRLV